MKNDDYFDKIEDKPAQPTASRPLWSYTDRELIGELKRRGITDPTDAWFQGYACATATAISLEGCIGTNEKELMTAGGLNKKACLQAKVDPHDMQFLFPKRKRK